MARVGYQVYCEYQKQLLVDLDGESAVCIYFSGRKRVDIVRSIVVAQQANTNKNERHFAKVHLDNSSATISYRRYQ